ncbi:unnamed protein product [Porites evermanni]|uniref:Uncharacterized protein n=1 Tax=Porites evermanni TaxID=104178 RepID=A0ABN8RPD1_9CNID|nr:unnamed protein product [Porites evermanni]
MSSIISSWYLQRMEYQKPSGWYLTTGPSIHTVAAKNLQPFANNNSLPSPAQLPNHRDYPTQLPISERLQRSQALAGHREQLQNRQNIERKQYDSISTLKRRKPIYQDEEVVAFQPRTETWDSSTELTQAASQSPVPSDQSDANLPMTTRSGHVVKKTSRLDL